MSKRMWVALESGKDTEMVFSLELLEKSAALLTTWFKSKEAYIRLLTYRTIR